MAEILATIVGFLDAPAKIKEYVIDPLKVQFSYLCCSNSILESLRAKVQSLENTRVSLQRRVDAAERNLENIRPNVKEWCERVDEIKIQTDRIFGAIHEVQQGCVNGSCPNLKLRYSVSRKAKKMVKAVDIEVQVAGTFDRVADPAPPPGMEIIPVGSGTEFESRKSIEEEIMAALRDNSVYLIGICGMGGVGKTTMAKKIWKRAREEKLFDMVAMPVISQQVDRKRIQQEIAEAFGLKLEQETESIRAGLLRTRLTMLIKEKRILVIIDDIWERLDLEELGIPSQGNHNGCKIILTSRNRHVCTEMDATNFFSLNGLLENEAWALFKAKAGSCVDNCDLHQIAKDVAKECKGLPLALVTVGCALRNQNAKPVWEDALKQLLKSAPLNIPRVLKDVYQPLQLSYNHLESGEARYLFLLCCLFPEDSRISLKALLYYGVGLRIFSDVETLREARNRLHGLVEMLESRYMLMDGGRKDGIRRVKMHDVIRDMAVSLASTSEHVFMINHDTRLKNWPGKDSYENYTSISLTLVGGVTLPECVNCPRLQMLRMKFFYWNWIPDTFFDRMRELNVLDIGNITSLPSSLQLLTNLRTLRLRDSKMKTVSMIGQLVKLEILDLRYSHFEVLSKEIGGLENLKLLDLRGCSRLREIAPGVISRLVRLEELLLLNSFEKWEAEVEGKERRNASLVEVASLKNLIALQLQIPDPKVLPQDTLHWPKLEKFAIWIGTRPQYSRENYVDNNLILNINETTPLVHALTRNAHHLRLKLGGIGASDEVIKLIQEENQNLKWLSLDSCDSMKYLANRLSKENIVFPILRSMFLSNCRDLEVICYGGPRLTGSFDALEFLTLKNLCKLTRLWDQIHCLPNLSKVFIQKCSSLQYVFLQSTAENLSQLQKLEIDECPVLEDVFKAEGGRSADAVGPIVFPNLTKLWLKELPNLTSFCKMVKRIDFPLLKHLCIGNSYNLKVFCPMEGSSFFERGEHNSDSQFLFHQKVTFASLVELKLYNINPATKIFSSQIPIGSFSRLERLEVKSCPNLKVIFSPPAFRNFRTLLYLIVENCSKLEEVVGKEDEELLDAVQEPIFPKLKGLTLLQLTNFKTFCHMKNDIELPQLENITIVDCHEMETFSLGSVSLPSLKYVFGLLDSNLATQIFLNREVTFESLVELKLYNIKTATEIFSSQVPIGSFSRLELLEVEFCPNLKVIFSPPAFRNFRTLGKLTVKNCLRLEEVVGEEDQESQVAVKEPLFPKLKELMLSELPNFKKLCHMTNDIELPQLERIVIVNCHQMETFSLGSLSLPQLTRVSGSLDPDLATQIFFKKEVTFASLVELKLCKLSATKVFSSQIPIGSFSRLKLLKVKSCPNLKVIFSPPAFRNFKTLDKLTVKNCSKLEEVVEKEDKESQATVKEALFPELKELILSELPNFKTFCHTKNDIELPQLESITIVDCHEMETFSLGSLSLPRLTYVSGLLEPELAKRIFFKKETPKHEIHLNSNSFTLSAKDLSGFESHSWKWYLAKDLNDDFIVVARLLRALRLRISGRFDMVKLSPGTLYEVMFEIMLEDYDFRCSSPVYLKLTQSEGITQERPEDLEIMQDEDLEDLELELTRLEGITQERHEDLEHLPRGEWIEILAGEFTTGPNPIGDLYFSFINNGMTYGMEELLIKGVTIRAKASSSS